MGNYKNILITMKFLLAVVALISETSAVQTSGFPEHFGEMFPNKSSMYGNDWERYKKTRQLMVDCDIYESENWLGTGKCKSSWECRGARQYTARTSKYDSSARP